MAVNFDPARRLDTGASVVVQSTGTSARTAAGLVYGELRLHARGAGWFNVGGSTVTATAGAGSTPLEAGQVEYVKIYPGQFVAWITAGGTQDLVVTGVSG
jgi:hypothetical protein